MDTGEMNPDSGRRRGDREDEAVPLCVPFFVRLFAAFFIHLAGVLTYSITVR
jgi:hypothetical protein